MKQYRVVCLDYASPPMPLHAAIRNVRTLNMLASKDKICKQDHILEEVPSGELAEAQVPNG